MTASSIHPDLSAMIEERASASKACAMLKILANEDRLLILCQLMQGKKNVGELEQLIGIRQPTLSQQLTVLREEKLVSTERKGKYIFYSLASSEAKQIMLTLFELYCQDKTAPPAWKGARTKEGEAIENHFDTPYRANGVQSRP